MTDDGMRSGFKWYMASNSICNQSNSLVFRLKPLSHTAFTHTLIQVTYYSYVAFMIYTVSQKKILCTENYWYLTISYLPIWQGSSFSSDRTIWIILKRWSKTDTCLFALDFIFFKPFNRYAAWLQVYSTNHSGMYATYKHNEQQRNSLHWYQEVEKGLVGSPELHHNITNKNPNKTMGVTILAKPTDRHSGPVH